MTVHIDSGFNVAGATCVRAVDEREDITRRYWFDETEDGRIVFVAEVHAGNGARSYIEEAKMYLLDQVAERACQSTGAEQVVNSDGKVLYEDE
jgi:hypothetical protein